MFVIMMVSIASFIHEVMKVMKYHLTMRVMGSNEKVEKMLYYDKSSKICPEATCRSLDLGAQSSGFFGGSRRQSKCF